ncbi:hypothetical protein, partial [Plasmodium yoelii yoelii]
MTTIEFCEKRTNYHNQSYSVIYIAYPSFNIVFFSFFFHFFAFFFNFVQKFYNKGLYKNLKEVFGESPFLWLLPI